MQLTAARRQDLLARRLDPGCGRMGPGVRREGLRYRFPSPLECPLAQPSGWLQQREDITS